MRIKIINYIEKKLKIYDNIVILEFIAEDYYTDHHDIGCEKLFGGDFKFFIRNKDRDQEIKYSFGVSLSSFHWDDEKKTIKELDKIINKVMNTLLKLEKIIN